MCFSFLKTLVFAIRKNLTFGSMATGKGGRPRLPEAEKKKHKVSVLLTDLEQSAFESAYRQSGYKSQTEFILARTMSLETALSPAELSTISELRIALSEVLNQQRRIGNNFNQLMHLAQTEKQLPPPEALATVAESFRALESYAYEYMTLIEALKQKWLSK